MDFEDFAAAFAEEWELAEEEVEKVLQELEFADLVVEAEAMGLSDSEVADILEVLEGVAEYDEALDLHPGQEDWGDAKEYDDEPEYLDTEYYLDADWPEDEWLDAGDWYEISGEYEENK